MPAFLQDRCMDCGGCVGICPHDAIDLFQGRIGIRPSCTECDLCVRLCPVDALQSVAPAWRGGPSSAAPRSSATRHPGDAR